MEVVDTPDFVGRAVLKADVYPLRPEPEKLDSEPEAIEKDQEGQDEKEPLFS
jgi:hypothetical protein